MGRGRRPRPFFCALTSIALVKKLDIAALEAAILGGLVLSAGASGASAAERHRKIGEAALELGQVELLPLERFHDDEALLVSTVIGAPGVSRPSTEAADTVHAARALVQASRCDAKAVLEVTAELGITRGRFLQVLSGHLHDLVKRHSPAVEVLGRDRLDGLGPVVGQ